MDFRCLQCLSRDLDCFFRFHRVLKGFRGLWGRVQSGLGFQV